MHVQYKKGHNAYMGKVEYCFITEILTVVLHYISSFSPCFCDVKYVSAVHHLKKIYPKLEFTSAVQEPIGLKSQTSQDNVIHINTILGNVTHSVTLHKCSVTEWVTMNAV